MYKLNKPENANPDEMVDKLVNENIKLAYFWANKYQGARWDFDQALSIAQDGLLNAAWRFNPANEKKCSFGNYAHMLIKAQFGRQKDYLMREIRGYGVDPVSLDTPLGEDSESTLGDVIAAPIHDADEYFQEHKFSGVLKEAFATLDKFERDIMSRRFLNDPTQTLESVADYYAISRARVGQIEAQCLLTLKHKIQLLHKKREQELNKHKSENGCIHDGGIGSKKFGLDSKGKQRFCCHTCGKHYTDPSTKRPGNHRIPIEKEELIKALVRTGSSSRFAASVAGVNKMTALRVSRRLPLSERIKLYKQNAPTRERAKYMHEYYKVKNPKANSAARLAWRERIRARICLILAKANRPLSVDEIHEQLMPEFSGFEKQSLSLMLNKNVEGSFVALGNYWTYQLAEIFIFHDKWPADILEARKIYFQKRGMTDAQKEHWEKLQAEFAAAKSAQERMRIAESVRDILKMFAAAHQITQALKPHE